MIQNKFLYKREDGVNLYITYSDTGHYIYKEGNPDGLYVEAIDVESTKFNYLESDKLVEHLGENQK